MLVLITGVPGSGKSLYATKLILDYIEENKKLIEQGKKPRPIYSDIDGMNIDGVLDAPDDWRECPDGSVVVYDECQKKFGPDGQGRSGREDIQEFETHRHRGFDIILITQHGKLLHAHIRRLVGRHYHVVRMYGTTNATIYAKDGHMDTDKQHQLLKEDNHLWSYPKANFNLYKSATVHTHKPHMPKFVKRALIGLAIVALIIAFMLPKAMVFFTGNTGAPVVEQDMKVQTYASNDDKAQSTDIEDYQPEPIACIANDSECVCYDKNGHLLKYEYLRCIGNLYGHSEYIDFHTRGTRRAEASAGS